MERHLVDYSAHGMGAKEYAFYQKSFEQDGPNPILSFGPIDVSLSQLFEQGMTLFAEGWESKLSSPRRLRIYLVKKVGEKSQLYRVGSAHFTELMEKSLQHFIKKNPSQVASQMNFPWWFDDPVEAVARIYGSKKKKQPPMMGNQTLKEFVASLE